MPKMLFRGAYIRFADLRYDEDGAHSHVRLDMTADFSEPIAREMQWNPMSFVEDLPAEVQQLIATHMKTHGGPTKWLELAGLTQAKLKGRIAATTIELIPNGELKQHSISLEANEVRAFNVVRLLTKDGNTKSLELRFQVAISQRGAAGVIENYLDTVGMGVAQLKVGYEKQEALDLDKSDAVVDEDQRMISAEQAADTASDDEPELDDPAQPTAGPTLAPRVLVEGNKPKRRSEKPRDRSREGLADGTTPLPGEVIN